jgi:hypothetical protein
MSYIVRKRVGNHVYLYEAVSYRNDKGEPRNKRVPVGKPDAAGQPVYKTEYIERMAKADTPLAVPKNDSYAGGDIAGSHIKEFGSFFLFKKIAARIGLLQILENVLPESWWDIFDLACFLVSTGEPFMYCQDWLTKTDAVPAKLTGADITRLLGSPDRRE